MCKDGGKKKTKPTTKKQKNPKQKQTKKTQKKKQDKGILKINISPFLSSLLLFL